MKPRFILAVFLSVASLSSASILFLDRPQKSSILRGSSPTSIAIKWGEGSEAGTPDLATRK
jgi:hypothetical protein